MTSTNKIARAALVTGAGKRLGRAMALALGADGFDVAVHYNTSRKDADDVVASIKSQGGRAAAISADLSDETATAGLVDAAAKALGRPLSLLINSASLFENDEIQSMTRASWDAHLNTNLRAPILLSQKFAAQAQSEASAGRDALIIHLIDQRALKLTPQFFSYTLSKAALHSATKTMAQALAPRGVRVNAIGPGPTLRNPRQSEEDWQAQNAATIMGRGATPDDIVAAMRYLIGATPVTGQMIAVDGGQHLGWETPDALVKE
ncbi:MAG: SDR family oxidoreductase [Pseudomonadota bacterium]